MEGRKDGRRDGGRMERGKMERGKKGGKEGGREGRKGREKRYELLGDVLSNTVGCISQPIACMRPACCFLWA